MTEGHFEPEVTDAVQGFNYQFRERLERKQAHDRTVSQLYSIHLYAALSCVLLAANLACQVIPLTGILRDSPGNNSTTPVPAGGGKTTFTFDDLPNPPAPGAASVPKVPVSKQNATEPVKNPAIQNATEAVGNPMAGDPPPLSIRKPGESPPAVAPATKQGGCK